MAGQCCRLNDVDGAIEHLPRRGLRDEFNLLGARVAFNRYAVGRCHRAFRRAIEIDLTTSWRTTAWPLPKRSAANWTRHCTTMTLVRRPCPSNRESHTKHAAQSDFASDTTLGSSASYAALYLASSVQGINSVAWPTGEHAVEDERTEVRIFYWIDTPTDKRETVLFLPNYFIRSAATETRRCTQRYWQSGNRSELLVAGRLAHTLPKQRVSAMSVTDLTSGPTWRQRPARRRR